MSLTVPPFPLQVLTSMLMEQDKIHGLVNLERHLHHACELMAPSLSNVYDAVTRPDYQQPRGRKASQILGMRSRRNSLRNSFDSHNSHSGSLQPATSIDFDALDEWEDNASGDDAASVQMSDDMPGSRTGSRWGREGSRTGSLLFGESSGLLSNLEQSTSSRLRQTSSID
jgi:hypothetical protein